MDSELPDDITELAALQADLRELVRDLVRGLSEARTSELAEMGSLLATLVKDASLLQEDIKTILRDAAKKELGAEPGTVTFDGDSPRTGVSVTIPKPRVQLAKGADMSLVQRLLGPDFDLYFETVVTHKPRPTTPDLIVNLPNNPTKTLLLSAVEEKEGTPRVSFKVL